VIRRVTTWFVPVAVNLYRVRAARDAGGDLFRSAQRQKYQYQGVWLVAPDGRVLAAHQDPEDPAAWARELVAVIDRALQAFGPVAPRRAVRVDPPRDRGLGVLPDGGITLAIEVREIVHGRPAGDPVIDSLTLTQAEAAALAPPATGVGTTWSVPEAVARRLCRVLSPGSDQSTMPRAEEVAGARLTGTVRSVEKGVARLSFDGGLSAAHAREGKVSYSAARLTGVGRYEAAAGRLSSLVIVSEGKYRSAPPYDKELRTTAAAVEWRSLPRGPSR
jgi:hypothetical protein